MKAEQQLYYSWKGMGKTGLNTFSKGAGITPEEESEINSRVKYVALTNMSPYSDTVNKIIAQLTPDSFPTSGEDGIAPEIRKMIDDTFPVNYAHFVLSTGRYCYARATYCGLDYQKSRWANYIIHAYVTDEPYPGSSPMLFWNNPFKVKMSVADMNEQTPPDHLPPVDLVVKQPSALMIHEMTAQVGEENVARFLQALVRSTKASVPLLVNADEEDILRYIAIAEMVLPPALAGTMTYSTYMYEDENTPTYRIKCVFSENGLDPFNYAIRTHSGACVVADFRNKQFTVDDGLDIFKDLLRLDFDSKEAKQLRQILQDYYNIYGDLNGKVVYRYRALLRGQVAGSTPVDELLQDLRSEFFKLPTYQAYIDRIIDHMLKQDRPILDMMKLMDFDYGRSPERRNMLVEKLVCGAQGAVESGQLKADDAVRLLKQYCDGQSVAYFLDHFRDVRSSYKTDNQNRFTLLMLKEAYRSVDKSVAGKDLLLLLEEGAKENPANMCVLLSDMADLPEIHRQGFSLLLTSTIDARKYEQLVEYGFCVCSKDKEFERFLCGELVVSASKEPLVQMLSIKNRVTVGAVRLYIQYAGDRFIGEKCREILWQLWERKSPVLLENSMMRHLPDCFASDIQKCVRLWTDFHTHIDKKELYAWFSDSMSKNRNASQLLLAVHDSTIHGLAAQYINDSAKNREDFIQYLQKWYEKEMYVECFRPLAEKLDRNHLWESRDFLEDVLQETKSVFKKQKYAEDLEYVAKITERVCFALMPETIGWLSILQDLSSLLERHGRDIPLSYDFIALAEGGTINWLPTQNQVDEFITSVGEDAYVRYVSAYMKALVAYLKDSIQDGGIEGMVYLVTGTGNREYEEFFAKQVLTPKKDRTERVCTMLEVYFQCGRQNDAMRRAMLAILDRLSVDEYRDVVIQMKEMHNSKLLTTLFYEAEKNFGFFKRFRLKQAEKKASEKKKKRSEKK